MNDIELIPLGKLRLSEANVRKNDSNLFIEELAANIEAMAAVTLCPWAECHVAPPA